MITFTMGSRFVVFDFAALHFAAGTRATTVPVHNLSPHDLMAIGWVPDHIATVSLVCGTPSN